MTLDQVGSGHILNVNRRRLWINGSVAYAFFGTGTGTPAILILNAPRLVRVQK